MADAVRARLVDAQWDYAARRWIEEHPAKYSALDSTLDAIQHARSDVKNALHGRIAQLLGAPAAAQLLTNPTPTQLLTSLKTPPGIRDAMIMARHPRRLNDPRYWATVQAQANSAFSRALKNAPAVGILVAIAAAATDVVQRVNTWAESDRERQAEQRDDHAHELELVHRPNIDHDYER